MLFTDSAQYTNQNQTTTWIVYLFSIALEPFCFQHMLALFLFPDLQWHLVVHHILTGMFGEGLHGLVKTKVRTESFIFISNFISNIYLREQECETSTFLNLKRQIRYLLLTTGNIFQLLQELQYLAKHCRYVSR